MSVKKRERKSNDLNKKFLKMELEDNIYIKVLSESTFNDLSTGEIQNCLLAKNLDSDEILIIAQTVLLANLEIGKDYEIVCLGKPPNKKYIQYSIFEV